MKLARADGSFGATVFTRGRCGRLGIDTPFGELRAYAPAGSGYRHVGATVRVDRHGTRLVRWLDLSPDTTEGDAVGLLVEQPGPATGSRVQPRTGNRRSALERTEGVNAAGYRAELLDLERVAEVA